MIRIRVFNTYPKHRIGVKETISIATRVLKKERVKYADLNIVFINEKRMVKLNGEFCRHWYTTDVLSFPLADDNKGQVEGEIYVNVDQAAYQSKEYNVSLRNEISRLVIHGILHIIGYDDKTGVQKERMTRLENVYLGLRT
jgi:rRNA maturation RNase YbeY